MEIHRKRTAHRLHKSKAPVEVPPEPITNSLDLNYEDFLVPVTVPVEVRAPIAEEQQREVFKWMLEEKRKVKPMDAMEKKQIDEENVRTGLDVEQPPTSAVDESLSNCSDRPNVNGRQSSCTSYRCYPTGTILISGTHSM
ncbi:hypothetical protein L195_g010627 [Trifolium pratense]|uniref:Uncharacterized protein n=1 Tax=Trifolium pratense TaxID=57577 RepID=A0A2K3PF86_TRIPR|nr:hypothetical protein L195_g010627 [Trifolium pratense]